MQLIAYLATLTFSLGAVPLCAVSQLPFRRVAVMIFCFLPANVGDYNKEIDMGTSESARYIQVITSCLK